MRIIHILPWLKLGGAEKIALDICLEINKLSDYEVQLIVLQKLNHFEEYDFIKYIPAKVNLSLLKKNELNVEELQQAIDDFQPEIIHSHLFLAEIVSRSCFYPKAKWFSHFHDNMPQLRNMEWKTFYNKKYLTEFYEKQYLLKQYHQNGGNQFIAISKDAANYAEKVLPASYKIHFLKNAINFQNFYHEVKEMPLNKTIQLVNVGSFQKIKNQQFLLDIVKELKNRDVDVQLTLLGDGSERNNLEAKVKQLNIENQIIFQGMVTNVADFLTQSHIYIHASVSEAFGLVLIEAMAAGLPVIALNGGGNADFMENNVNSFIFNEQNVQQFAQTIIDLSSNTTLYQKIAMSGQKTAQQYDIKSYCNQLLKLYKS